VSVLVRNLQKKIPVEKELLDVVTRAARMVMKDEQRGNSELSIVFADDEFIRKLNLDYRGIDTATDVLSFPQSGEEEVINENMKEDLLGDVVISLETAARQAEEYGHSLCREAVFLVVHGTLHLLGYDHEDEEDRKKMRSREKAALAKLECD